MSNPVIASKAQIRQWIAQGELRTATAAAVQYAEYCQSAEPLNALQGISARLEQDISLWTTQQVSYEDFSRAQAQVAQALLTWTDRLPNDPKPGTGKKKLLEEAQLQTRLLWLFITCKGFVLGWVWFRWTQTGALNTERAMILFGVLAPTFVATLYIMMDYYLKRYNKPELQRRRVVSGPLVLLAYALLPVYAWTMWYILQMGVIWREWTFVTMTTLMSAAETAFGGLIGKLVATFFKSEP